LRRIEAFSNEENAPKYEQFLLQDKLAVGIFEALQLRQRRRASTNLTRRANHQHIFIVARIKPAPKNPPRAFSI
jgi:hypothetical protein